MKKKHIFLSSLILFLLLFVTFYIIFKNNDIKVIYENIKLVNINYLVICLVLIVLYFLIQGIYMKILLKSLDNDISILRGVYYSIIEFFFSAITPSSTGGQPVQLYYMSYDDIPIRKSLIVLILNTLMFKLFLIVFGVLILITRVDLVFDNGLFIGACFFIGIIFDALVVVACYMLMYNQDLARKVIVLIYKIKSKIKKQTVNYEENINLLLDKYIDEALYIKEHKKEIIVSLILTFIQRIMMFSITYFIYRGLGFNKIGYYDLLIIQIFTQITIEAMPLPGGTGVAEGIINNLYLVIFGSLSTVGMILTRTFTFYLPLFVLVIIIIIITKIFYKNKEV